MISSCCLYFCLPWSLHRLKGNILPQALDETSTMPPQNSLVTFLGFVSCLSSSSRMFSHKGLCVADHLRPSVFETALVIASHSDASLTRSKIPRFKVQYLELWYSRWFPKPLLLYHLAGNAAIGKRLCVGLSLSLIVSSLWRLPRVEA